MIRIICLKITASRPTTYAFCRIPPVVRLPYGNSMWGAVAFWTAMILSAALLLGGIAFLTFFEGDAFTAAIFSLLPAVIAAWFGLAARSMLTKD